MTAQSMSAARAESRGPGKMNTMKAIRIHRRGGPEVLAGIIRPIVEAVLPLDQAREAYERGIREHPRGKLVLGALGDGGMSGARHG